MNTKYIFTKFLVLVFAFGSASSVLASEHQLYTLSGFVDLLIERGIISADNAQKARDIVALSEKFDDTIQPINKDKLDVSVSQFIENGTLTYNRYEDVQGLLLLAKNNSDTATQFEAKRGCQVVYRIYSESDILLYDSSTEKKCATGEVVTYMLGAGESRLFEVTHRISNYTLQPGTYRFLIVYPGYGEGEREVTIK